jgi:CubicO group peptidase (beta-lactamase class C family)
MMKLQIGTTARVALLSTALALGVAVAAWLAWGRSDLERRLDSWLAANEIPGAVLAIGAVGGEPRLLALGKAAPGDLMTADDSFRLASLAKPITAAAVLLLARDGKLELDADVDPSIPGVTIRQLLQHSGGWDRALTSDPIADPAAATALGVTGPHTCMDVAKLVPPREFVPGTRYAYSNIGYCWLGAIIEKASGRAYAEFVSEEILSPRGAHLTYDGVPTVYYVNDWPSTAWTALGPGGGWTGTAAEYWRFAAGPVDPEVMSRPAFAIAGQDYYGLGWRVWPDGALSHYGSLPGAYTFVMRLNGKVAVLLFNGRPPDDLLAQGQLRDMLLAAGFGEASRQ